MTRFAKPLNLAKRFVLKKLLPFLSVAAVVLITPVGLSANAADVKPLATYPYDTTGGWTFVRQGNGTSGNLSYTAANGLHYMSVGTTYAGNCVIFGPSCYAPITQGKRYIVKLSYLISSNNPDMLGTIYNIRFYFGGWNSSAGSAAYDLERPSATGQLLTVYYPVTAPVTDTHIFINFAFSAISSGSASYWRDFAMKGPIEIYDYDEYKDQFTNPRPDINSKSAGVLTDAEDAENAAKGGKTDEQIQNEVKGTTSFDVNAAMPPALRGQYTTFMSGTMNAFGSGYYSLLVFSCVMGVALYLIGKRKGT
jgi:hypothetical protein